MAAFMKMVEKDMHHYLLATLLAVFIVSDMGVPPVLSELINYRMPRNIPLCNLNQKIGSSKS